MASRRPASGRRPGGSTSSTPTTDNGTSKGQTPSSSRGSGSASTSASASSSAKVSGKGAGRPASATTSRPDSRTQAAASRRTGATPEAKSSRPTATSSPTAASPAAARTRTAKLRLTHVDPLSVMKVAFLLSIAVGIIAIVAVFIIWGVLGAAGVWDSINSSVQQTVGSDSSTPFDITDYLGTGRVVGFTMLAAVIDVIVMTALATLGAFVYNLAATLLGGVEMTYAEDR